MILKNLPTLLMLFSFCYANTCIQRDYSFGSVCVCNSTYCDTAPEVSVPLPGKYDIFTSSSDGLRFNKTEGDFKSLNVTTNSTTYHINKNTTYQEILGFGGAFTDSTGINILSLSLPTQDQLLESYFSPKGIEYTIGRVPIGGTDFSTHGYTYHDNITDANLGSFNLTNEDFEFKIPLIKRAQSLSTKPLKLLASCWSPPVWMKTSKSLVGIGSLKEEYYQTYANYHVKFFDEYKKQGVEFWCVSTGNEPSTGVLPTVRINALGWTPMNQIQWIKNNFGPSMRSAHPNTCIMAIDDQRFSYPWWLDMIMQDEEASKYINGSAVHWYYDFMFPPAVLSKTHEKYPNLFLLNTESCYGSMVWDQPKVALGSWSRAESYAGDIIDSINNWVTGWVDWNLALDETGGPNWVDNFVDAPIIVNKTADEFYKQPIFYILGHFSKFITPGSLVLSGNSSLFNVIKTLAVKRPDNSIAVVFLNRESFDVQLTFVDDDRGMADLNLPKHSISTMIYQ